MYVFTHPHLRNDVSEGNWWLASKYLIGLQMWMHNLFMISYTLWMRNNTTELECKQIISDITKFLSTTDITQERNKLPLWVVQCNLIGSVKTYWLSRSISTFQYRDGTSWWLFDIVSLRYEGSPWVGCGWVVSVQTHWGPEIVSPQLLNFQSLLYGALMTWILP